MATLKEKKLKSSTSAKSKVFSFMQELIDSLEHNERIGTALNYRCAMRSFSEFLNNKDITFSSMTCKLISNYEWWLLCKGVVRNSSSFYLRILRSVYNKAVNKGLATPGNPFVNVYTGVDRTRKRAMNEQFIKRLVKLEPITDGLRLARDLFLFSYCMRGMAFVDIAYLKKSDISGEFINYIRRKTNQQLSVRIEPIAQNIINHYANTAIGTPYVFPIITTLDPVKGYRQYRAKLGYCNRQLKTLSKELGVDLAVSTYWARHSWATSARNKNVPLSVISAAMGHTSEKTTEIYLASLGNSIIDKANSRILSSLKDSKLY